MKTHAAIAMLTNCFLVLIIGSGSATARDAGYASVTSQRLAPFGAPAFIGHLENPDIAEASGMIASRRRDDVLWITNDSGDAPVLYAVNLRGTHLGRVHIRNARNVDWEDLAAFGYNNSATLLIADLGDNLARRKENDLYFVREPDISDQPDRFDISIDWHRRIRFVYEDGPRDCEAVAIDTDGNQIFLLTKRTVPPVLYSLPLKPDKEPSISVARRLATIENMLPTPASSPPANARFYRFRSQPTAMDISPDGSEIAILTYGSGAYLYRRPAGLTWPQGFGKLPAKIKMPPLRQAETLCFSLNGKSLFVTSERRPAPLYRIDRHSTVLREATP